MAPATWSISKHLVGILWISVNHTVKIGTAPLREPILWRHICKLLGGGISRCLQTTCISCIWQRNWWVSERFQWGFRVVMDEVSLPYALVRVPRCQTLASPNSCRQQQQNNLWHRKADPQTWLGLGWLGWSPKPGAGRTATRLILKVLKVLKSVHIHVVAACQLTGSLGSCQVSPRRKASHTECSGVIAALSRLSFVSSGVAPTQWREGYQKPILLRKRENGHP